MFLKKLQQRENEVKLTFLYFLFVFLLQKLRLWGQNCEESLKRAGVVGESLTVCHHTH